MSLSAFEEDLKRLIKRLKEDYPQAKLAFNSYSIGAHIAPAVAVDIEPPIALIVDRGFEDGNEMAENLAGCWAKLPFVKRKLLAEYNVKSAEKVANFAGSVLFFSPPLGKDALLHRSKRNLAQEFYDKFPEGKKEYVLLPENSTHFSSWDEATQTKAIEFLKKHFTAEVA